VDSNLADCKERVKAVRARVERELQRLADFPLNDVSKLQTPARPTQHHRRVVSTGAAGSVPPLNFLGHDDEDPLPVIGTPAHFPSASLILMCGYFVRIITNSLYPTHTSGEL